MTVVLRMRFVRQEVWNPDGTIHRQTLIQPRYIDLKREKLILTEERYEVLDHRNGDIVEVRRSTTSKAGPLNQRATAYFGSPSYGPARALGGPQFFPFVFVEGDDPIEDVQAQGERTLAPSRILVLSPSVLSVSLRKPAYTVCYRHHPDVDMGAKFLGRLPQKFDLKPARMLHGSSVVLPGWDDFLFPLAKPAGEAARRNKSRYRVQ